MTRRKFLKAASVASVAVMTTSLPTEAVETEDAVILVPADKGLGQDWLKNLYLRGEAVVASKWRII